MAKPVVPRPEFVSGAKEAETTGHLFRWPAGTSLLALLRVAVAPFGMFVKESDSSFAFDVITTGSLVIVARIPMVAYHAYDGPRDEKSLRDFIEKHGLPAPETIPTIPCTRHTEGLLQDLAKALELDEETTVDDILRNAFLFVDGDNDEEEDGNEKAALAERRNSG